MSGGSTTCLRRGAGDRALDGGRTATRAAEEGRTRAPVLVRRIKVLLRVEDGRHICDADNNE